MSSLEKQGASDKLLLFVALFASLVAVAGAGFTYYSVSSFKQTWNTGFIVDQGQVNISINPSITVNFTKDFILIHNGSVNSGNPNASIDTSGLVGGVSGGTFVINETYRYMIIENIGNKNVTLNITASKTPAEFIGGTGPQFRINISNNDTSLSCVNSSGGLYMSGGSYNVGEWVDISTTSIRICDWFNFGTGEDEIRLDAFLAVPSDSNTGNLTNVLSSTIAEAV